MFAAVGYASAQARVRALRSRLIDVPTWRRLIDERGPESTLDALATSEAALAMGGEGGDLAGGAFGVAGATFEATGIASSRIDTSVGARVAAWGRALRRRQYREAHSLADDVPPRARELLRWYADRFLVHDVKVVVRALHHGHTVHSARDAMTLDPADDPAVAALTRVRVIDELPVELGDRSPYGRALANAWEQYRRERRSFYLEVALDLAYHRGLVERIEALKGGDRADAIELLGRWLARTNLLAAGRYRVMSGVSPEEIVNFCLHKDFGDGLAMVQRVAVGASIRDEAAALGVSLPREGNDVEALQALEHATDRLRRDAARARFSRSPFGLGLVLAYLIELEAESTDLITLLEAKLQALEPFDLRQRVPRAEA
ncbi:MAG: V-type ATPase subunit [Trueperaceae bacterium]